MSWAVSSATVFAMAPITSSASVVSTLPKPPTRCGVLGEKIIDQFDHHTMKAGALLVYSLF